MKKIYLSFLFILISIFSISSCKHIKNIEIEPPAQSINETTNDDSTDIKYFNVINKQNSDFENLTINYIYENNKNYNISVKYPSTAIDSINGMIEDTVYPYINDYKDAINNKNSNTFQYDLTIDFKVNEYNDSIINFEFNIRSLTNDGEQIFNETLVLNLENGKLIPQSDITTTPETETIKILETTKSLETSSNTKVYSDKKLIALTFDDGPNAITTPILLDGLAKRNVKATFFMLGTCMEENPDIVKRIYQDNHGIGNHSYSHKNLIKLNNDEAKIQYDKPNEILNSIIGTVSTAFRPPYGNYNDDIKAFSDTPIVLWNIDPQDWKYKDTEKVANHIINKAKDGDIILLHDIYDTSVKATFKIIDTLKEEGFTFVTIDQLIRRNDCEPTKGKVFRFQKDNITNN